MVDVSDVFLLGLGGRGSPGREGGEGSSFFCLMEIPGGRGRFWGGGAGAGARRVPAGNFGKAGGGGGVNIFSGPK